MSEPMAPFTVNRRRGVVRGATLLLLLGLLVLSGRAPAGAATPFTPGDVVVGLGSSPDGSSRGELRHFSPSGALLGTLLTGSGSFEETGACFDASRNLYTTNFEANSMSKFGPSGALLQGSFGSGFNEHPNSCVVDGTGNVYVGQSDRDGDYGGGGVLKLSAAGAVLGSFSPDPEARGTDWIDLAPDDCALYYTSVGASIKRFDVCTSTQLPDFCTACDDGAGGTTTGPFFGLRVLPDGGVLVADWNFGGDSGLVRRYTSAGTQVTSYATTNAFGSQCGFDGEQPCFFPWALALAPDHASVWVADNVSGEIFRFDLASGNVLGSFVGGECSDLYLACSVTGLAVVGERGETAEPPSGTQEVTASITAASKVYDGTTAATITSCILSGVLNGDDVSCVASGGAFASASVGNGKQPVSATVSLTGTAAASYGLSSTTATTTASITPAPASVTPSPASKTYGASDPALTGTLSDFIAADGVTATYSRTAGESVAGSPYTISAMLSGGAALANYTITYNTASFTIAPLAASVTPDPASKTYGTADPILTGTLSGFLPGDSISATYSRVPGENVAGSPYAITAVLTPAAALLNYTITQNSAAFTITPATPVVTWADPADITYPTPLGGTQLNATADVPGAFAYTPPAGTVLLVGNHQPLSVQFTPTDSSNYATASAGVHINVLSSDVSVAKTTDTPSITVGEIARYSLVVTGHGPGRSSNVTLTDTLPAGLDWTVGGPDANACSPTSPVAGGATLTCDFGTVPSGATRGITLTGVATVLSCGDLLNTATVSALADADPQNDSAGPVTITVNCPAIAISKSTSTPSVMAGDTVSYLVTVTAGGTSDSTNVTMTDTLPAGLSWTVTGPGSGACSPASPVAGGSTLTCSYGTLHPGEQRSITLTAVTTAASCGTINNTATVTDTLDISPGDNSAGPVPVQVNCPDVSVLVSTGTPVVDAGNAATYSVVVTGNGPGTATGVVLTDTLPAGHVWTVGGPSAGDCLPTSPVAGGTTLSCNFGTLAPGATRAITLTAVTTTASCGTLANTATVTAAGDTDAGNNSSGPVSVTVVCPVPPSVSTVRLVCPNVSLVNASFVVNGAVEPATSTPVTLLYISPTGASTSHLIQSAVNGTYSDTFTPNQVGPWTVKATAQGVESPACPVLVYGKSVGGTFVVGDGNTDVGDTVDFWGSQWWMKNTFSGGIDPGVASMKGYLSAVDLPAACGSSWSTRPGNSSKPPATIPEYVAVIVASTVSKNGPTIAGDVVSMVIVRTNPGYGPAPGHPGSGTIVGTICEK